VRSVAPASDKRAINQYEDTLERTDAGIKSADGLLTSHEFVQEVVHLTEQRDPLFKTLKAPPSLLMN